MLNGGARRRQAHFSCDSTLTVRMCDSRVILHKPFPNQPHKPMILYGLFHSAGALVYFIHFIKDSNIDLMKSHKREVNESLLQSRTYFVATRPRSAYRKSQCFAPCMMVPVRRSSTSPVPSSSTIVSSNEHNNANPSSGSPNWRKNSAKRQPVMLKSKASSDCLSTSKSTESPMIGLAASMAACHFSRGEPGSSAAR